MAGAEPVNEAPYDTGSDAWWRAQAAADPAVADQAEVEQAEVEQAEVEQAEVEQAEVEQAGVDQAGVDRVSGDQAQVDQADVDRPKGFPIVAAPDLPTATSPRLGRSPLPTPRSPLRAVVGALVAVGGVGVVIVALLVVRSDPSTVSPAVIAVAGSVATAAPAAAALTSAPASPAPTNLPAASLVPASAAPSPLRPSPLRPGAAAGRPAAPMAGPAHGAAAPHAQPAPRLPLTVLNNSQESGLADRAATAYRAGGWSVVMVGNYTGQVAETTVYFAPGQEPSARRLARQFSGIVQVLPRIEGLPGSGLTVVLTRDYAA